MEQAAFCEDRSSKSDPLEPDDETLIWSAGTFFDPSLAVRRLKLDWIEERKEKKKTIDKSILH